MENRSLVTIAEHSKEKILYMLEMAKQFEMNPNRRLLQGKVVATLFFEPSTRTRLSFETAANRLGARVIGFSDPKATSSSKGETLKDTIMMPATSSVARCPLSMQVMELTSTRRRRCSIFTLSTRRKERWKI